MKIAFVTSHPIQYQVPVFRELTQRGYVDLTVLFAQIPDGAAQGTGFGVAFEWDIPLLEGYRYHVLKNISKRPSVIEYQGCDTPGVFEFLKSGQFDAVIVNGWVVKTCLQTLSACRRLGIPCLVRGEANHLRQRAWWKRVLQRFLIRRFSGYLYIGEANREFYRSYGVSDSKLFPCRYCVENARFEAVADDEQLRRTARERWQISADAVCFLYSGKFETKKHPVEIVKAFRAACQSGMQAQLLMVGDGELRAECEELVRRDKLPVLFTGFLNQQLIPEAYLATDCLVLASDAGETWGLVVNEAMSCGRPAIVSDLVGCRADLIDPGRTGETFHFGDWQQLSNLLLTLSQQPEKLRKMGQQAQTRIQHYSPLEAAKGIEAAVASLERRKSAAPGSTG